MAFSISLTKLKALLPVAVVGGAIAITIKLLTQENLPNSNLLNVEAQEDIKPVDDYQEVLEEEPEPEKEEEVPKAEEPAQEETSEEDEDGEEEGASEGADSAESENEEQQQQEQTQKEEEEQSKPNLTFKDSPLGNIFKEIFA